MAAIIPIEVGERVRLVARTATAATEVWRQPAGVVTAVDRPYMTVRCDNGVSVTTHEDNVTRRLPAPRCTRRAVRQPRPRAFVDVPLFGDADGRVGPSR